MFTYDHIQCVGDDFRGAQRQLGPCDLLRYHLSLSGVPQDRGTGSADCQCAACTLPRVNLPRGQDH